MEADNRLDDAEYLNLAPNSETKAGLYIYADEIDIAGLTKLLGAQPTSSHLKGAKLRPRSSPTPNGGWFLEAPKHLSLPDKIKYLLDATTSNYEVWDMLVANHIMRLNCVVFLHSWRDGIVFPAALMEQIGRRHWEFNISLYSADDNDIVTSFLKKRDKKPCD